MTDLAAIWLRLLSVDRLALDRYGVSFRAEQIVGGVRQGRTGWILACFVDPPSIYRNVNEPVLEDFCVFDPARPSQYRTIYGNATMLGEAAYREAEWYRAPLPMFKNPLHWLQAAGGGVCILEAGAFGRQMLGSDIKLVAEDPQHGEDLHRIISRAARITIPSIYVRKAAA